MRCLITGEPWAGPGPYSPAGLRLLNPQLKSLQDLPYTRDQLLQAAATRAVKMSIQGMQPKVSTILRVKEGKMAIVDNGGRFILKPPHLLFAELPENETLTMSLAATVGIEVPLHGLIRNSDGTHSYFIRRFDRAGRAKLPVEDFAQLSGASRETKYDSSTEKLIAVIDAHCTFPALERLKLLDVLLFVFLTGNEDMHLKNWSLITRDGRVELSPAYDLLNSTIANDASKEELALPLRGIKSKLKANDFWVYLAVERLGLSASLVTEAKTKLAHASTAWPEKIANSFLSSEMKQRYLILLQQRRKQLDLA